MDKRITEIETLRGLKHVAVDGRGLLVSYSATGKPTVCVMAVLKPNSFMLVRTVGGKAVGKRGRLPLDTAADVLVAAWRNYVERMESLATVEG